MFAQRFKRLRFPLAILLCLSASAQTRLTAQSQSNAQSVPQKQIETALTYGLVVDCSGSLRVQLSEEIAIGKYIIGNNRQDDATFLTRFISTDKVDQMVPLTQNKAELIEGLDDIFSESGQTAIIDALYVSAEYLVQQSANAETTRRRALILITDGEDSKNHYKLDKLLELLREKKVRVYVVGLSAHLKKDKGKKTYERAVAFLNSIANETGGHAVFPEKRADLTKDSDEILKLLRQP